MNVVIYARFSSHSQTEQSIEGQLKVCYAYAEANQMNVVGEYIDRAQTGTNDNRPSLQRMLMDSDKHTFEGVIVYQLDRFARNRFDSAINKAKLKKNGVRVISAKENIADDPSGILVEGVLESMAEYYSAAVCRITLNFKRYLGLFDRLKHGKSHQRFAVLLYYKRYFFFTRSKTFPIGFSNISRNTTFETA